MVSTGSRKGTKLHRKLRAPHPGRAKSAQNRVFRPAQAVDGAKTRCYSPRPRDPVTFFARTALLLVIAATFACQSAKERADARKASEAKPGDRIALEKGKLGKASNKKKKGKKKKGKPVKRRRGNDQVVIHARMIESKRKRTYAPAALQFSGRAWEKIGAGLTTMATDFKDNVGWVEVLPLQSDAGPEFLLVPRCAESTPEIKCTPNVQTNANNAWTLASCQCTGAADEAANGKRPLACQPTFVDSKFSCTGDCGSEACSPVLTPDGRVGCPCTGATAAADAKPPAPQEPKSKSKSAPQEATTP